ncbi:uncharacterized protein LOC123010872 [Tribolium madens]|uniref:uncharacterized protein LOC123010872 n=1 Tax=Tribolium madens TaxID=41895 RepID=UPI001CF737FB|nr:uncharacterized protein LOC123010872 [Tribolium madens]
MDEDEFGKDDKFVNIYGREIPAVIVGKQKEIALSLTELKQTGVAIYQKSQYEKLSKIDEPFDSNFVDYMLESAKAYMLNNKVSFSQDQIMRSIENCKSILIGNKSPVSRKQPTFLKHRSVAKRGDDEIFIQLANTSTQAQSSNPKQKMPDFKNINPKLHVSPKISPELIKPTKQIALNGRDIRESEVGKSFEDEAKKLKNGIDKTQDETKKLKNGSDKTHDAPKRFSYNTGQRECTVFVTQIDKRNCVWVRDKANDEILESIHAKINEEVKYQKVASKPWKKEKVYMAEDEGCWFRCKIVRMSPLTVFFLDYGNIAEVDEIMEVSEDLAKIPCLAVRITFKEAEYMPVLEDEIRINFFYHNSDGTYFVNVLNSLKATTDRNDQTRHSLVANEVKKDVKEPSKICKSDQKINEVFFKKPPLFCEISEGQLVAIVQVNEEIFYLRTKECFTKLKDVEAKIEEYSKNAKSVVNVKLNQVVLHYNNKTNKFNRVVVLKVSNDVVEVEALDYPERFTTDLKNLKLINEQLSKEPITCFPAGRLTGFENKQLGDNCKEIITKHIKTRTKFRVVLGFDDEFDLFDGSQLLSDQLLTGPEGSKKIYLKDVTLYKPEIGVNSYLCGYYKSSDNFAIVPSKELQEHIDYVLRSEIEDSVPYIAVENEVCLCYFVDQWYRCAVIRIFDKECEVMLLDFGNVELIRKENLRKPDDHIMKVPALALPCKLIGLPSHQNIEAALKKIVLEGELYNVDVKKITEGKCHVKLPEVYAALKD